MATFLLYKYCRNTYNKGANSYKLKISKIGNSSLTAEPVLIKLYKVAE